MLFILPYMTSTQKVSFAACASDSNEIKHFTNIETEQITKTINNLNKNNEQIVTYDFQELFTSNDVNIIDIFYLEKLFQNDFLLHKNDIITIFKREKIRLILKSDIFFKLNREFCSTLKLRLNYQFSIQKYILDNIQEAFFDYLKYVSTSFLNDMNKEYFKIFKNYLFIYNSIENALCHDNSWLEKPEYNLFSSKTGRPYISSGTNYQRLKKSVLKQQIKSRYENGAIYEFDYNGCEIRAALYATKQYEQANMQEDIYTFYADKLLSEQQIKIDRAALKQFLIPMLFGASQKTLVRLMKQPVESIKKMIIFFINEFKLNLIASEIDISLNNKGYITNLFGRPILVSEEDKTYKTKLVQNYIQSTAIDICHSGYSAAIQHKEAAHLNMHVLYTKHDAIGIDMSKSALNELDTIKTLMQTTNLNNINFLVKAEKLNDI